MRPTRRSSKRQDGYRSGLEAKVAKQIEQVTGLPPVYEQSTIRYRIPARDHRYTPDFVLPNGVVIECKGIFDAKDRAKHLLVKEQHPERDIRFIFTRSQAPIYPRSKTTLAAWCQKNEFKFADKLIPIEWFK